MVESQHRNSNEVIPDPLFRHPKEKRKKAVWLRETTELVVQLPLQIFMPIRGTLGRNTAK